jgi:wobble nucleotide-excising tRNase
MTEERRIKDRRQHYEDQARIAELEEKVAKLEKELSTYKYWASSVNESLNMGNGTYRP